MGNLLGKGASLATETISKSGSKVMSGAEKLLGKGKSVEKAENVAKGASKDATKTAENTAKDATKSKSLGGKLWNGTKKAGSLGVSAASGIGGAAKKAGSAVLGKSGGMSSMLKYGAMGAVVSLLLNKNTRNGITNLVSGAANGLGKAASNTSSQTDMTNKLNNGSAMADKQYSPATNASSSQTKQADHAQQNYNQVSDMGHDQYKQQATQNLQHVMDNQPQLQKQNQQQSQNSHDQQLDM